MGEYLMTILWAIIFVIALGVEAATAELVAIWFLPGTVVSLILSLVGVEEWVQGVVFAVISVVLFVLAFTVIRKRVLKKCDAKTDTNAGSELVFYFILLFYCTSHPNVL